MSSLEDTSLQPSAKGCSNSSLSMWKFLRREMKGLHTGCYHRSSWSKYAPLPSTSWHTCQFGMERSLRLPPIRNPGPKQVKVPSVDRIELFESFLPSSLLYNPPSSLPGEEAGQDLSGNLPMIHLPALLTFGILSTRFGLNQVPLKFISWNPDTQCGCIWSNEVIKVKGGRKRGALIWQD